MAKKKGRGWHGDSKRHSQAAKKGWKSSGGGKAMGVKLPRRSGKLTKSERATVKKTYKEASTYMKQRTAVKAALLKVDKLSKKTARAKRIRVRTGGPGYHWYGGT